MSEKNLVPFGKYKGQPLEVIAQDRSYCEWLLTQPWFVERFPQVHTVVINNFGEPSETPEHNALQIRLLDDVFRLQVTAQAFAFFHPRHAEFACEHVSNYVGSVTPYLAKLSPPTFEHAGIDATWTLYPWSVCHDTKSSKQPTWLKQHYEAECEQIQGQLNAFVESAALRDRLAAKHRELLQALHVERQSFTQNTPSLWGDRRDFNRKDLEFFEQHDCLDRLIDVLHVSDVYVTNGKFWCAHRSSITSGSTKVGELYRYGQHVCRAFGATVATDLLRLSTYKEYFEMEVTIHSHTWRQQMWPDRLSVECKPLLGDDYPAVLRQMKNVPGKPGHLVLLAGAVRSQTVPLEAIRKFFALSNICLLLVDEVEQAEPMRLWANNDLPPAHEVYMECTSMPCEECDTMARIEIVPF